MSYLKKYLPLICLWTQLLISCGPGITTPLASPTPPAVITLPERSGATQAYSAKHLDQACTDILPFDGEVAFLYGRADQPILWTFGVNFDLLSPEGNPVGCFKLYERRSKTSSYELIQKVLADVCTIQDTDNGKVRLESGNAVFEGGYIECSMDLGQWVRKLTPDGPLFRSFYQDDSFQPRSYHKYDNFTMVAKASVAKELLETKKPIALPVVSYYPDASEYSSPALSLDVQPASSASSALIALGRCKNLAVEKPYYLWYDLRRETSPNQRYAYREIDATPAVYCGPGPDSSPLTFSIEQGTLYIGYDPTTQTTFFGTMDGVLVDPTDSRPK